MANYTQEQILDALGAKVAAVAGLENAITDARFIEEEGEVVGVVSDQHPKGEATGVLISLKDLENVPDENPCKVHVIYKYELVMLVAYKQARGDGITSKRYFEQRIFALNEALNASRSLGLDNRVEHKCLQSDDEFAVVDWGGDHGSLLTHFAKFSLDVEVENGY